MVSYMSEGDEVTTEQLEWICDNFNKMIDFQKTHCKGYLPYSYEGEYMK